MMEERRSAERLRTNISVRWESLKTQGRGSVCDLSVSGCFVLSAGEVEAGEVVRLKLILDDQISTLWGYIVYRIPDMGFAVRLAQEHDNSQRLMSSLNFGQEEK